MDAGSFELEVCKPRPPALARLSAVDQLRLFALSLAVLLPGVWGVSLFDRDEGWYAEVAREMAASGDLIVPRYLGQPWIGKPPLLYWCIVGLWQVLGQSAAAARLVSVLAMCAAVQGLATLAARMYDRQTAWVSAVVFLTAALPAVVGRLVLTDALLLACVVGSAVVLHACATRGPTLLRCGLFWLLTGLGVLAKGPAAVLFVGAWGLVLVAGRFGRRLLGSAAFWLTLPVFLLVALPWYVLVAQRAGQTLVQQFFWYEILARFVRPPHGHVGPPGYYVLTSLAGWLPWSPLVPGAIFEAWQRRREDRDARLLLGWLAIPWLILELVPGKLPHYVLPAYVPIAILFARMWVRGAGGPVRPAQWRVLGLWAGLPVAIGLALVAAAGIWKLPIAVAAPGVVLLAGFGALAVVVRRRQVRGLLAGAVATMVAFYAVTGLWTLPALEPYRPSRQIAERANAILRPGEPVAACGYREPVMFFYLRGPGRPVEPAALAGWRGVVIAEDACLRQAGITPNEGWARYAWYDVLERQRREVWIGRNDK